MASINKLFLTVALFIIAMGPSQMALAQIKNYSNVVEVCNKGDVDLDYIVFATKKSFLGGEEAKISGWYTIKRGKCQDVNPRGFQGVTIGFKQKNSDGITGNLVYHIQNAGKAGSSKRAPAVICAPTNDSVNYKNALGIVRDKYLPPCRDGFAEFKMSFYDKPNDVFPTITLKPRKSDPLNPWPGGAVVATTRSSQNSEREMSGIEILGKVLLGAAHGLEDGQIKKLSSSCKNSALTLVFEFSEEGPAAACQCLSRKIVRLSGPNIVSRIVDDIDAGRDFDDAIDIVPEDKLNNYLEACISSPSSASSSTQGQPIKELTLEQQAAALFPVPAMPLFAGGPAYNFPKMTQRLQRKMKSWEQLTGKNFLTDHWSMKPRTFRNERGVLTKATTRHGEWPNILAAYNAAEETIMNSYTTNWYRVATVAEMRQCIRPAEPKKPRACSDPERSFMIPECFQSSSWREPQWCATGYDQNYHMTSIAKTEHGGQISYGNRVGDCLVRADADGSPLVEARNNGKEIRGYFFKDNLLKKAFVTVECGQVWRDFSNAVYNARTDQEFVAADPLAIITANENAQASFDMAVYHDEMRRVMRERENWIAQQRSGN